MKLSVVCVCCRTLRLSFFIRILYVSLTVACPSMLSLFIVMQTRMWPSVSTFLIPAKRLNYNNIVTSLLNSDVHTCK
jgi:hypothetical protein